MKPVKFRGSAATTAAYSAQSGSLSVIGVNLFVWDLHLLKKYTVTDSDQGPFSPPSYRFHTPPWPTHE